MITDEGNDHSQPSPELRNSFYLYVITIFGAIVLCFLVSYFFRISDRLSMIIWPKYGALLSYCSNNNCVFNTNYVSSVYIMQLTVSLAAITIMYLKTVLIAKKYRPLPSVVYHLVYIFSYAIILISYFSDFSFEGRLSLFSNSVSHSYISIVRIALSGFIFSVTCLVLYFSCLVPSKTNTN